MPRQRRRNSQKYTKKNQKRYRHGNNDKNVDNNGTGSIAPTTTPSQSIEEDLKQQRIRQEERRQKQLHEQQKQQQEEEEENVKDHRRRRRRRRSREQGYDSEDNTDEDDDNDTADIAADVLPYDHQQNHSLLNLLLRGSYNNSNNSDLVGRIPSQLMGYIQQINNVRPIITTTPTTNYNNTTTRVSDEELVVQSQYHNRRYGQLPLTVRLRDHQYCSYVMENMGINPNASSTVFGGVVGDGKTKIRMKKKWYTHSLSDGRVTNTMFTCKDRLHPQARTFDVAFPRDDDGDGDNGSSIYSGAGAGDGHGGLDGESNHSPTTPTISTVVQGGWGVFQPTYSNTGGGFSTIRCPPVHAIRMHESSGRMGTILRPSSYHRNNNSMPYQFHIYPLPRHVTTTYLEATLPQPANDFCFGKDIALFACPHIRSTGVLLPIFLHLEHGNSNTNINSPFRKLDVRNFPQSDALRVEMKCSENDKFIAFGHRNGQVSLIDLRAPRAVSSILHCELSSRGTMGGSAGPFGPVSDLTFLGDHGMDDKLLLVKRSFGSCQLHDLRMSSSVSFYSSETAGRPRPPGLLSSLSSSQTLVQNFTADDINPTLSLNCNGFAVDRIGHVLFSPYICSNGDACLGLWSLRSGKKVGSKVLMSSGGRSDSGEDVVFVEMSQRLTPYYVANKRGTHKTNQCGMWLKCGAFTKTNNISSKAGDLYHISIPGRYSP